MALAWGFLLLQAWHLLTASGAFGRHPIRQGMMDAIADAQSLKLDIAQLIGAQVLLHTLLGLAIWMLALAVRRGYPQQRLNTSLLVLMWATTLMGSIYILNAAAFPWSDFGGTHGLVTITLIGTITLADVATAAVLVLSLTTLLRAATSFTPVRAQARRIVAYSLVAVAALAALRALELRPAQAYVAQDRPHVIIVGIDSLRPDAVGQGRGMGLTPNVDAFLKEATTFTDATTPLARTFSSWITILSGQHPVRSGARDNLMPRELLKVPATLAHRLRALGYSTMYATDEVRFSNIDQSFGFDRVIGPKMGASDFMLTRFNDLPLSNLVANSRLGQLLFPNTYGNRAAAATYQPDVFVDWVERELDFQQPAFVALHLTLPHWPYHWADANDTVFGRVTEHPYTYLAGVVAADRQFGQLMQALEHRGALENAIVVVLSDHGEGLGLPSDNLLHSKEAKKAVGKLLISMSGHGSSVLSPNQYQVVLGIRQFGRAQPAAASSVSRYVSVPASLEDVAPTLLELLGARFDADEFDGYSLAAQVRSSGIGSDTAVVLRSRVRFTETGLTTTFMRMGNFSEGANAQEAMNFYTVEPQTSRVVFRREKMGDLLMQKERAAISNQWLLAAVPDPKVDKTKYILVNRAGGVPEVVTYDPDSVMQPVFAALWQAMRERWGTEVAGQSSTSALTAM